MKHSTTSRTVAVAGTMAAAASFVGMAPAQSAEPATSQLTVHASDTTVRSGEQFVLSGRLTSESTPLTDATVRVKTYRNGTWVPLTGAVVSTNDEGRYRVRVVLSMKGTRQLRVVGNPRGEDIRTARKDIAITVR